MYIPGVRFEATVDGVIEAGLVEMRDVIVDTSACFRPVGGALSFGLIDAELDSNAIITVTISYANAQFLAGDKPDLLKVFQKVAGAWDDLASTVDTTQKTVTAVASAPGSFSLGYDVGCGGGAGGGLARPGAGIVVDFVASIKKPSPPPASDPGSGVGGGSSGGGSGGGSGKTVVITNNQPGTYPESYFAVNPLQRIQVKNVGFSSLGIDVFKASTGQPITLGSTFTNQQQQSQSYSFIVMIIDENGYTLALDIQNGTLEAGETAELTSGWTTQDDGIYTFKIFVWNSITNNLMPLAEPTIKNIRVDPS
jgi:hypothetical protein